VHSFPPPAPLGQSWTGPTLLLQMGGCYDPPFSIKITIFFQWPEPRPDTYSSQTLYLNHRCGVLFRSCYPLPPCRRNKFQSPSYQNSDLFCVVLSFCWLGCGVLFVFLFFVLSFFVFFSPPGPIDPFSPKGRLIVLHFVFCCVPPLGFSVNSPFWLSCMGMSAGPFPLLPSLRILVNPPAGNVQDSRSSSLNGHFTRPVFFSLGA